MIKNHDDLGVPQTRRMLDAAWRLHRSAVRLVLLVALLVSGSAMTAPLAHAEVSSAENSWDGSADDRGVSQSFPTLPPMKATNVDRTRVAVSENIAMAACDGGPFGNPCRSTPEQVGGVFGVVAVAGGLGHSLALDGDGTVWAWGSNDEGQLGDGTTVSRVAARKVPGLSGVTALAAGLYTSFALKADGTIWSWGTNDSGELGTPSGGTCGGSDCSKNPILIQGLETVIALGSGGTADHTLALKADGTVWGWGWNEYGQLGVATTTATCGTTACSPVPVQIPGLANITAITTGYDHSLAVAADGGVWAWGGNGSGQLGPGVPQEDDPHPTPVRVTGLGVATAVAGDYFSSSALLSDGSVWSWGYNDSGQRGDGSVAPSPCYCNATPGKVTGLADTRGLVAGDNSRLTVQGDGTIWAWGYNRYGQLGLGTSGNETNPTAVRISTLTGVVAVAAGERHRLAVKSDGTVWTWGNNSFDQLGELAPRPSLNTGASSLAFGDQALNTTGASQTTTLRNSGTVAATISGITSDGDFAQTNDCPPSLAAGGSCAITVSFTPTVSGARTGTLQIASDAPGNPLRVGLTGNGVGTPALNLMPPYLTFGDQALASQSQNPTVVTLTNTGTGPANLVGITLGGDDGGDFVITAQTCGSTLAPGANCTITVAFKPGRGTEPVLRSNRAATLTVQKTTQPTMLTAPLSGRAVPPPLMYVHGIRTDSRPGSGFIGFQPLLKPLRDEFPFEDFPNGVRFFAYYQDKSDQVNNCIPTKIPVAPDSRIALPYPPVSGVPTRVSYFGNHCDSQSDFGVNVVLLYQEMVQLYNDTGKQRPITMACHSMGCTITRGFLAYAAEINAYDSNAPKPTDLVDSVLFIQGVQAGSILAKDFAVDPNTANFGLGSNTKNFVASEVYRLAIKESALEFDYNRPAIYELRPQSAYFNWMRQETVTINNTPVPHTPDLPYFNVYGDVHLTEKGCLFVNTCWDINTIEFGDLAILPGNNSPYGTPVDGGARFLKGSFGPQNWQWEMYHDVAFYAVTPLPIVGLPNGVSAAKLVYEAPENHLNLGKDNGGMTEVMVNDCANPGQQMRLDLQLLKILRGRLYGPRYNCQP